MAALKWLGAGALISFGIVGFLTGLVLVPFGIALAFAASHERRQAWLWLLTGLGVGPIVLLAGDVVGSDPPTGAVPAFWTGIALVLSGVGCSVYMCRRNRPPILN